MYDILPDDPKEAAAIKRKAPRFYYNAITRTLYRRSYDGILLRFLSRREAQEALMEAHDGTCGAHQPGAKLWDRLRRLGYYWPRMISDAIAYARRCYACQIHGEFMHQAPGNLHPMLPSWPFEMWGMDIIGPINPPTSKGHRFILAITNYFSKWAEVIPLKRRKDVRGDSIHQTPRDIPLRCTSTTGPNSSADHFRNSATSSEFKVCR